jgi:GDP-mannose 4,6-dehydratase
MSLENGEFSGKKQNYTARNSCRICGSEKLTPLFSLGNLCISTFVNNPEENIGIAPLELVWCEECTLVQLKHTAPQELMYSGHYWYRSGFNKVIMDDLKEISEVAMKEVFLKSGDIALDIGANDGTLLNFYPKNLTRVGCEPATNLTEELKDKCDIAINDFWTYENYVKKVGLKKAKIITAIGMFYDMEDPNQFIRDASKVLDEDGIFVAQLMTSKKMLEQNDVGNICHEHIEFYSYQSLKYLFENNGLEIFKVEENPINGGSYRLFARKYRSGSIDYPENLTKQDYLDFARRIDENKKKTLDLIKKLKEEGKKIYGYGASTKGNTILQYYGLGPEDIEGIAEISEEKFGKYTVGSKIPIINENESKEKADCFLVLPYAFRDSFLQKNKKWIEDGGKFIFVLPELETVSAKDKNNSFENKKKALILGITGQDGSYLAELLLKKGYEVHGMLRKSATGNTDNIEHIKDQIHLHKGNLTDPISIYKIIDTIKPEEIYNEADQDHVSWSFDMAGYSYDVTGAAVGKILEIIKQVYTEEDIKNHKVKYFQPLSSNIFGIPEETPQNEETKVRPQSPYACGKVLAQVLCKYYRDVYGMFISTAIFYNHESPRRTEEYVTHKITKSAIRISKGLQKKLYLGDLSTRVDFGYAPEYMEAAWNIMQLTNPEDFVICTGETHSVKEFLEETFKQVGLNANDYVEYDKQFERPGKTGDLVGDFSKATRAFGYQPKIKFKELIKMLIENDLKEVEREERR